MSNVKSYTAAMLCLSVVVCLLSCGEQTTTKTQSTAAKTDTLPKPRWNDPGKGKIFGKVNVVQIPLTAYEEHIFGAVKSVTYKDYKVSYKDGSKTLDDSGFNVYDKAGHLVDQNEYGKDRKMKWHCTYKYDDKKLATEWVFAFANPKRNSKTTFKYDDKGRKLEQIEDAADKTMSRRLVYKYDDKGNEVEEDEYYSDKKTPWTTTYQYDARGFQVWYVHKDETGRVLSKTTKEYDAQGNTTSGISYTSDTTISGKMKAVNDKMGRTAELIFFKKDGTEQHRTKLKYDEWDNITELVSYKPDGTADTLALNFYSDYEYDGRGNVIKETSYKMNGGKKVVTGISEKKYEYY